MGFTTGFTGGVTLVLGAAYLTVQAHQRNREQQSEILRAQTYVLNTLSGAPTSQPPPPLPPSRAERAAIARANFVETAKDRWNAEVEGAVRWVQAKDWVEVRENAEEEAERLWTRLTGAAPAESAEAAKAAVSERAASVTDAAKGALAEAKAKSSEAASETKEAAASIWQRGLRKAKAVVGLTQEKALAKAEDAKQS